MSLTAVGNGTLFRRPPRNSLSVMLCAVGACEQPVRSDAHGLRSHRLRSLLSVSKFCRMRDNYSTCKFLPRADFDYPGFRS